MEARRFYFLEQSIKLTDEEKESYKALIGVDATGDFQMFDTAMEKALLRLSSLLCKHYGKQVILLIDEYDVPLDKAFQYGYYDEMVSLIRNMFGNALKTNPNLFFAVLTGCLRISKESIFTGLNNLKVLTLTDVRFDEYFGFTDTEVKDMLDYYDLSEHYAEVREWFRDVSRKDGETLNQFCEAFLDQNPKKIEEIFSDYLWNNCKVMLG